MKILQIHNHYGSHSGETTVLEAHKAILKKHGHDVKTYTRSSVELENMRFGKVKAFFTALYNPSTIRKVKGVIKEFKPDIVHIHNLYPFISPSILPAIRRAGIPIVMTVHNYRLMCPNGLFYNKTGICERCTGGKEWNCVRLNCEESLPKSCGYALRNACARVFGFYINNVNSFLCLTDFQKRKLIENGFSQDKCKILPNFPENETNNHKSDISFPDKKSFLFIGRLNRQKGIDIIIKAAKQSPEVTFILAGSVDPLFIDITKLPSNVRWHGVIGEEEKRILLQNANALLFASRSYEGFPMVFLEAMENGLPVIAPYLAGYPEIIRKEQNGWLFKPEDSYDLSKMIKKVSENPELSLAYGQKGKNILNNEYNSDVWYREYMHIVKSLIVSNKSINV